MANPTGTTTSLGAGIPPDDLNRKLTIANPDDPTQRIKNELVIGLRTNITF